ncbi:MAG: FAD-dependent oxidoreductase, partial [Burkholderiales bacterium PBB5]
MRVVVVGGGAVGAAVAMFLKREAGAAVQVTVVEPDPTLALASSARSAASIRQQFSNAVNVQLSRFGFEVIDQPGPWLAVDGQTPALGLQHADYLFLATTEALQCAQGATIALLSPQALAQELPWLHTGDVLAATRGRGGEGWFDGEALARALAAKARALGAVWQRGRVVGGRLDGPRLAALQLADGQTL